MKTRARLALSLAMILCLHFISSCTDSAPEPAFKTYDLTQQQCYGRCISYSGYREGQNPQKFIYPSQAEILEDLKILEKNWILIRTYGSDQHSEDVLQVIRREKIGLKVMLGIWLDGEPGHEEDNAKQIDTAIRLANDYQDIVVAVNVGNEILVHWSNHKVPEEKAIQYVRQVQDAIAQPVTVADDFLYWRENGQKLADAVDFVTMHTYPMWGKQDIDTAIPVTLEHYTSVAQALPGKTIVIGEAGWATYTVGELHAPRAGDEAKQQRYFTELMAWAEQNDVNVFFFEAFDEPWKGSGTEGHWGLFSEGRKAKLAMREWYPDLLPDGPTSPGYEDEVK
ncbi:glycosyl hydrolase [candidate division KSB1 bacterium]|nr:glycosyl hydrolase [candidate division KSB1 bacterium]RQW06516.1 MAG: glycosyl hydrolase [candidate division KSB1 bacterium]